MTKTPKPTENSKTNGQHKTPPKASITQRLRTDLGRSVEVTTVIQLVWLNRFTGTQPLKSNTDTASSWILVSTIGAQVIPKKGDGTRCTEG